MASERPSDISSEPGLVIRRAVIGDMPAVWALVLKKAEFDQWLDRLEATPETLAAAMFAEAPAVHALLAEIDGRAVGLATYFHTFSTFLARRGLWLDDLYVEPEARRRGVGRALLRELARMARAEGCKRLEWVTGAGNERAIRFYEAAGAAVLHTTRVCRMDAAAIDRLADQT